MLRFSFNFFKASICHSFGIFSYDSSKELDVLASSKYGRNQILLLKYSK